MARDKKYIALWNVMKREGRRLVSRPLYLFCMVIAPLFCYVFFTTLMDSGLPVNMPVGVVDQDMTSTSRQLMRNLDAFEQTAIVAHYPTINEARAAMQKGEIYGFYYIPKGTTAKAQSQRQPTVSFYTNNTLLIAMQKPDASLVAGFSAWKNNFERNVMKGQKGIKIIAPSPYKIKQEMQKIDPHTQKPIIGKDGKPVTEEKEITIPAYKVVSVFDVSQTEGKELPDRVFEEAGALAAYYSKGRGNEKVEVDYIQRKNLKKVPGAAPGFVVYHTNYSLMAVPGITVQEV